MKTAVLLSVLVISEQLGPTQKYICWF